jgi:predicted secreted hydrolase
MLPLLLIAGAGAGVAWLGKGRKLPPGQNPFDAFPLGVDGSRALTVQRFKASSGCRYKLSGFSVADGRTYVVAEKQGDVDWLSYFVVPTSGERTLWAANADKHEEIAGMLADFQLSGGAA